MIKVWVLWYHRFEVLEIVSIHKTKEGAKAALKEITWGDAAPYFIEEYPISE